MPWPATPRHSDRKHVFNSLRPFVRSSLTKLMNIQTGLLSRRSRQRERVSASVVSICSSVCLFVCLSPKCQKTLFSQKVSNLELWCLLTTYRKSYMGIIGPLKSKMAEIRHLGNRHDVILSAEGGPIWIKFRRLVQNDMSTAVIWSKLKPDVEFQYGERLGEFHGMSSQSHTSHCGCCHWVNSLSWFQSHMPHCRVQSSG